MWQFPRQKPFNLLTSAAYRLSRLPFLPARAKYRIFSDLAWIFGRVASETSTRLISREDDPSAVATKKFLEHGIRGSDVVLDLGCASGEMTRYAARLARKAVGIDHSPTLIEEAKGSTRASNVTFYCDDALKFLSASSERFDVLICSHILEHLDDPETFLVSFAGHFHRMYIEVPDNDSSANNYIRSQLGLPPLYSDADHIWEFTRADLQQTLERAGCRITASDFSFGAMRVWVEKA
jgi:SAM-dependent methyltransferase